MGLALILHPAEGLAAVRTVGEHAATAADIFGHGGALILGGVAVAGIFSKIAGRSVDAHPGTADEGPVAPYAAPVVNLGKMGNIRGRRIPAGEFEMGDNEWDEAKPVREVYVSEFDMAENLVTAGEYRKYVEEYQDRPHGVFGLTRDGRLEILARLKEKPPAGGMLGVLLSLQDVDLSQVDGVKSLFVERVIPEDEDFALIRQDADYIPVRYVNWYQALGFARAMDLWLPTEAQWERAAKGPTGSARYGTATGKLDPSQARYNSNSPGPVGSYPANGFGLFDMAGNLWQWAMDWYQDSYQGLPNRDPIGPQSGMYRVKRGGSWCEYSEHSLRAAHRFVAPPYLGDNTIGFRLAGGRPVPGLK